ncbi:cytochrome P450 [Trametes polyzona]|nr:cytochrome P450 [Trametes polyzona]
MVGIVFVAAVAAGFTFVLRYLFRGYWERSPLDNLPGPPSPSFLLGSVVELSDHSSWKRWREVLDRYGPVSVIHGMFGTRMLHLSDPRALHSVLIKENDFFPKSLAPLSDMHFFLGPGLLTTEGAQNRKQRKLLNPVFSVAHLRDMTPIFYKITHRLRKAMDTRIGADGSVIDVNGWMARTTLEMLGQAGLGYSFDNFVDDSTDAYGASLKSFFPVLARITPTALLIPELSYFLPRWLIKKVLEWTSDADVRRMVDISDTMAKRSLEIINGKKALLLEGDQALAHEVGEGKDIMSLLLKANMIASDAEKHTDEELIAQMSTFILGGMDTTSNALSRIFHLLAQKPDVQDRLRAEISEACSGNDLAYDDIVKLPFMDAVCRETLRLYAPVQVSTRDAAQDTTLPLLHPIRGRDGSMISEVPVPKGTTVLVHFTGCNTNRDIWGEDVYEWKPERWLGKPPQLLDEARVPGVYSQLLTFSGGSRSCIGFKFSQLEMKIVLAVLLSAFRFELTDRPITWASAAVLYPTSRQGGEPEMFLKVSRLG